MSRAPDKRTNLGRGLSAFFGDDCEDYLALDRTRGSKLIPIERLHPNPLQPRRSIDQETILSLAESIRSKGVLQPILARRHPHISGDFEIVAGERRWRAAQLAGLENVPLIAKELTDGEALEVALAENLAREDLSPLEEAEGYQHLITVFQRTQDDLARSFSRSRSHIANTLRLLNLPVEIRELLRNGQLTAGHARALLGAGSAEELARVIVRQGLSVREAERLAKTSKNPRSHRRTSVSSPGVHPDATILEHALSTRLGLKVRVRSQGTSGSIIIKYNTLEQLDEIVNRINSH